MRNSVGLLGIVFGDVEVDAVPYDQILKSNIWHTKDFELFLKGHSDLKELF